MDGICSDRIKVCSNTFTFIDKEDHGTGLSLSSFIMRFNYKVAHIQLFALNEHLVYVCTSCESQ